MRRTRTYGITVALAIAVITGLAVVLLTGAVDGSTASAIDNISETLAAAFAVAACAIRAHRVPQSRRAWRLLAAAAAAWGAGQAYWSWAEITSQDVPFPSWADLGYLAALPLAMVGLSILRREVGGLRAWTRAALDGVLVSASLLCLSWVTVLGPLYRADADTAWAKALALAYPTADVVIVTIAIIVVSREHDRRTRVRYELLTAGFVAIAAADAAFAWMSQQDGVGGGHLVN